MNTSNFIHTYVKFNMQNSACCVWNHSVCKTQPKNYKIKLVETSEKSPLYLDDGANVRDNTKWKRKKKAAVSFCTIAYSYLGDNLIFNFIYCLIFLVSCCFQHHISIFPVAHSSDSMRVECLPRNKTDFVSLRFYRMYYKHQSWPMQI